MRTSLVFDALGKEGALDVVLLLLKATEGATVDAIVSDLGLKQPTVSRRLADLESAGLIDHALRGKPFRLRETKRVAALLRDASHLSEALFGHEADSERAFRERLP